MFTRFTLPLDVGPNVEVNFWMRLQYFAKRSSKASSYGPGSRLERWILKMMPKTLYNVDKVPGKHVSWTIYFSIGIVAHMSIVTFGSINKKQVLRFTQRALHGGAIQWHHPQPLDPQKVSSWEIPPICLSLYACWKRPWGCWTPSSSHVYSWPTHQ